MQRMPAQPKEELMMPAAARSREASSKHETVVLGFGLGLDALAVSGGDGVDVLAYAGGANEGDAAHLGMGEEESRPRCGCR